MNYSRNVGKRIARIREKRGLTAEQLAESIGISPIKAEEIESGGCTIDVDTLYLVCIFLKVSPVLLMPELAPLAMHEIEDNSLYDFIVDEELEFKLNVENA